MARFFADNGVQGPRASTRENGFCETFRKIWEAYPSYDYASAQLVEDLKLTSLNSPGGTANTCTIRMSMGLLGAGIDVGREARGVASAVYNANLAGINPPVVSGTALTSLINLPNLRSIRAQPVLIRVRDMTAYITRKLGPATWSGGKGTLLGTTTVNGERVEDWQDDRRIWGKAGIIMYTDCGWTDATGHWDVYDGRQHRGHGHADVCKTVKIWNVCGTAIDRAGGSRPVSTPATAPLPPSRPSASSRPSSSPSSSSSSSGSNAVRRVCATMNARIRADSSTDSATVTTVRTGARLSVSRQLPNGWYAVTSPRNGFISPTVVRRC